MSSSARTKDAGYRTAAPSRPGSKHEPVDRAAALEWAKANGVRATPSDTFQHRLNSRRAELGLRWSPDLGQADKLGSPFWKDEPDDGQAEAVFG